MAEDADGCCDEKLCIFPIFLRISIVSPMVHTGGRLQTNVKGLKGLDGKPHKLRSRGTESPQKQFGTKQCVWAGPNQLGGGAMAGREPLSPTQGRLRPPLATAPFLREKIGPRRIGRVAQSNRPAACDLPPNEAFRLGDAPD